MSPLSIFCLTFTSIFPPLGIWFNKLFYGGFTMNVNRRFITKIILVMLMISFCFPVFSFASDDVFVWSGDDITSTVNADMRK